MQNMELALIGGTGITDLTLFKGWDWDRVDTVYGVAEYAAGSLGDMRACVFPRHGRGHTVPPHLVNYQAVIAGIRKLNIRQTLAFAAVGSLSRAFLPGSFGVLSDFIDYTKRRQSTFFDRPGSSVVHTDFTQPYCPSLSAALLEACSDLHLPVSTPCVYLCVDGPRYETPAEIRTFASWGADVVGMTNVPEVVLAREAGICYATLAVVTNFAAGISEVKLSHEDVVAHVHAQDEAISSLIPRMARGLSTWHGCDCKSNWEAWEGT